MKFKRTILILLIGMIFGIILSPFTNKTPKEAFISPVSVSFAETKDFITPISQGSKNTINEDMALNISKETNKNELTTSNWSGRLRIAIIGDSMIDVMGTDLPYLKKSLRKRFPNAKLELYNYGIGGENIEKGLARIESEYNYKDRKYPALTSLGADIIIIDSFAYNPFEDNANELDRHWTALGKMVDIIKTKTKAKIIIMTPIAPDIYKFGQGPGGVNWPQDQAKSHAQRIMKYLQNTVNFAKSAKLILINGYSSTLNNGNGSQYYISSHDYIHQNIQGNQLMADFISQKIYNNWVSSRLSGIK